MITFENTDVCNFEGAIRGMRNPLASHSKSDSMYWLPNFHSSKYDEMVNDDVCWEPFYIGESDMDLAKRLVYAGTEHRKFLRQIFVSVDILAPLYWWKQYETYKIGTTSNSYSTMHKIHSEEITINDFSCEDMSIGGLKVLKGVVDNLELTRRMYLNSKDKKYWLDIIKLLPESYNQKRTVTMNYENILNMCKQRKGHKLKEWEDFREWAKKLPYAKDLLQLED